MESDRNKNEKVWGGIEEQEQEIETDGGAVFLVHPEEEVRTLGGAYLPSFLPLNEPACHEHKHSQKLRQALPGQEAADSEPVLDFSQGLNGDHSGDTLSWSPLSPSA